MLKIRALNRESSSDEDAPGIRREAQEEIALDMYNEALKSLSEGSLVKSEEMLTKLIDENIPQLESQGGLPKTMSTIKYSCYINLGRILLEKNEVKDALENYLIASQLDGTDVTLWFKIGKLAIKLDRFRQAAYAFSKGLECSDSHWPCLDQLITLLYAIQDTIGCLCYIGKALILDPYYIKGLVLRKCIYASNPATKDYYKEFNPDHILEPDFEVEVPEEHKEKCLLEVQVLCDQINEAERRLEPPPLPTIALPTALEDYTWVALGRTLIDLHKYISDNHMSHFSKIDLSKCMSQNMEIVPETEAKEENVQEKQETEQPEAKTAENTEQNKDDENVEPEAIESRRISQNSENNANEQSDNVTPTQTDDNDEMEQDMDDAEENAEQKNDKNRSHTRGTKRRRDLLSDLQIWGWHSKRKSANKKGKHERDLTVEDALTRIIPPHFLRNNLSTTKNTNNDDSMNTMDLYNLYMSEKPRHVLSLSPIHSPRPENNLCYFGSDQEKEDVLNLWTKKWESCDAVSMIEEYVFKLSKLWNVKWPERLVLIYLEIYGMFREHCDHPRPFCTEDETNLLIDDCLATVLFGELLQFNQKKQDLNNNSFPLASMAFLQLVTCWNEENASQFNEFFMRVQWLRTHVFRRDENNVMAIQALQLLQEEVVAEEERLGEKYILSLPNCAKCSLVTTEIIEKLLKHLELVNSLSQLEKLYEMKEYTKVATILKSTFGIYGNHPTSGRMGRPAQLGILLHSLWFTDIMDCFIWTEECLHESLQHFVKPSKDRDKWEMVIEKCLGIFLEIIKMETVSIVDSLSEDKRSRLVETLARIVCHQLNNENTHSIPLGSLKPWIVLHYILLREDHREQAKRKVKHTKKDKVETTHQTMENSNTIPLSIEVLFSAHQFLGPKGWCLTGQGELLHFMLDTILDRLDTPIFEKLRDKIDIHIEQALFCLYQHPSKKNKMSRHLADHNVNPLPLSWERAHQLYEFYCPDRLPEFDSYRSISISSDLEQLLQRLSAIVPTECDPQAVLPKVIEFVNGSVSMLPDPIEFPHKVRAMYYLLGDYYFKQNEVGRSLKYFQLDLCINPLRLDSWACIALVYGSQLEGKLNHCESFRTENEFLDKAKSAQVCFRQALKLANDHVTLWIEFGSFEYMVHSFCSRVLKYESDTLSMEKFEVLENIKDGYLTSSSESFQHALSLYQPDQSEADERWLYHYMLAKIAEKQRKEPLEYLQHYLTARSLLEENNATYPDKISYTNPQHLSLEALEVHYRIHASILKYLELHEGKPILSSIGKIFKKCLNTSLLPKKNYAAVPKATANETKSTKAEDDIWKDVKECVEDLLTKVEEMDTKDECKVEAVAAMEITEPAEEAVFEKPRSKNIQDMMDALMQETMSKQAEVQDTDSDVSNITTVEPKSEVQSEEKDAIKMEITEIKTEVNESESNNNKGQEQNIRKSTDTSSSSTSSTSSSSSTSDSDTDDSSTTTSTTSSDANGKMSESEVTHLIDRCIAGLEQCIIRLPQNYKAIYRLAHVFFNYKSKKDLGRCRQLLLGEYKCKNGAVVSGLFSDRKTSNFFNGVWRIPSSEIDRPGSLAAHMGRCASLLLQVLRSSNDYKTLLDLCLQLRRAPDADKVYIRDAERKQLSEQAMSLCIQSLRSSIKNTNTDNHGAMQKLLLDIFRAYQKVQKHIVNKEGAFANMLMEMYKKIVQEKIPENVNILDLAVKYCQQNKPVEKPKVHNYMPVPRAAVFSSNPPVLPTPSNVPGTVNPPLKRPTLGRPRGRPKLDPKIPGHTRSPRGRSPGSTSNPYWQNQMPSKTAYDYMKQYQEQLIRQYSSTLTLNQLTQIGQYLNQAGYGGQYGAAHSAQAQSMLSNLPAMGGNLASMGGNLASMGGNLASVGGNLTSVGGNLTSVGGNLTSVGGSVTSMSGNLTSVGGSTTSRGGIVTSMGGNLASLGGNLTAVGSNLASKAGSLTSMGGNSASKGGNLVSKGVNLASKSGNLSSMGGNLLSKPSMKTFCDILYPPKKKPTSEASLQQHMSMLASHMDMRPSSSVKTSAAADARMKQSALNQLAYLGGSGKLPPMSTAGLFGTPAMSSGSGYKYSSGNYARKNKSTTKTTSSFQQAFLEATRLSAAIRPPKKQKEKPIKIHNRPGISITPVTPTCTITSHPPQYIKPPPPHIPTSSPGKTLQEKLAEKQKQLSSMHLQQQAEARAFEKPAIPSCIANITLPTSLTITRANPNVPNFLGDSGISISEVPLSKPPSSDVPKTARKEKTPSLGQNIPVIVSHKSPSKPSVEKQLPANLPISMSVIKKMEKAPERKSSSDDDVIIIE